MSSEGSGFSARASRASAKPLSRRNSSSACSGVTRLTERTAGSRSSRSASPAASPASAPCSRKREMLALPSQLALSCCTFDSSR